MRYFLELSNNYDSYQYRLTPARQLAAKRNMLEVAKAAFTQVIDLYQLLDESLSILDDSYPWVTEAQNKVNLSIDTIKREEERRSGLTKINFDQSMVEEPINPSDLPKMNSFVIDLPKESTQLDLTYYFSTYAK